MFSVNFILDGSAEILFQPVRFKIWKLLKDNKRVMYIDEIANNIGIQPRLVSYHIDILESKKFLITHYEIKQGNSKRGIVVRLCELSPHAIEVLKDIKESI